MSLFSVYVLTVICRVWNLDVPVYVFTMLGLEPGCPCLCIYNVIFGTWMSLFMYLQCHIWNMDVPVYVQY
jgi:hypothetical protein